MFYSNYYNLIIAQIKREVKPKKPKVIIKKKADAKTVWAACRAVIFGCIVIGIGLAMTVLGYFDKHFSERILVVSGISSIYYDKMVQYQLKSMQDLHSCSSQVTTERDQSDLSGAKNNEQAMHISGNFADTTNSSAEKW
uniref:DUF2892 domain-containing protein n=1 Tax=Heterorhabditis bacteriophora TaxID=37862 RepID=A0A1I7XHW8_HETBA